MPYHGITARAGTTLSENNPRFVMRNHVGYVTEEESVDYNLGGHGYVK